MSRSRPRSVLMNVDTGVDDALAILLALHATDSIRVVGIVTSFGNTSSEQAALNTRYLLERFECEHDIPVISGARQPLVGTAPAPSPHIHGVDGLAGLTLCYCDSADVPVVHHGQSEMGADFILSTARELGNDLTIVSTAPLTNLALAIRSDPKAIERIAGIEIMAGAFQKRSTSGRDRLGNVTAFAEFNAYSDAEALWQVTDSRLTLSLYPLDVSETVRIVDTDLSASLGLPHDTLNLITAILKPYMDFHSRTFGFNGAFLHDVLPLAAVLDPSLFEFGTVEVVVDRSHGATFGQTRRAEPGERGAQVNVALKVDATRLLELFWSVLSIPGINRERTGDCL